MKKAIVLALAAVAVLSACGGGGDSASTTAAVGVSATTPPVAAPAIDQVTAASTAVAAQANLALITASADEEAYDVVADIGDSWRVIFNTKTGAYTISVTESQFGLRSETGVATRVVNGNFVTYTATSPGRFVLVIDNRTKSIAGNVTLGGKSTTVAGTGYAAANLTGLAGTYTFFGAVRDASGGTNPEITAGQVLVNATGTSVAVCDSGRFNATNQCVAVGSSVPSTATLALTRTATGQLRLTTPNGSNFGILNISAGDRGPVLLLDRFGFNNTGTGSVLRVGRIYAVKQSRLSGSEFDGNFSCSANGVEQGTVAVSGTSLTGTERSTGAVTREVLTYNQAVVPGATVAFDGVLNSKVVNEPTNTGANILALSSSLVVVNGGPGKLSSFLCRRTN